jgi:hypothetical protein
MAMFPSSMPYDTINIIDQSQYTETVTEEIIDTVPSGPIAFIPFVSPRGYGEDNKLIYMTPSRLAKYGTPNLKKYGLSLYLANRVADAGGTVLGMRVMPDGAAKASYTVWVKPEIMVTNGSYEVHGTIENGESYINPIKFNLLYEDLKDVVLNDNQKAFLDNQMVTGSSTDLANVIFTDKDIYNSIDLENKTLKSIAGDYTYPIDEINSLTFTLEEKTEIKNVDGKDVEVKYALLTEKVVDGSTPLVFRAEYNGESKFISLDLHYSSEEIDGYIKWFTISSKSAGEFANNFKFRFEVNNTMTTVDDIYYNLYTFDGNNKLDKTITVSFNEDLTYDSESMYIEDVVKEYSENISVEVHTNIYDELKKQIDDSGIKEELTIRSLDMLSIDLNYNSMLVDGNVRTINVYDGLNLSSTYGINLIGGTDGWDDKNDVAFAINATDTESKFDAEFVKAYDGTKTDLIWDEIRFPFQFMYAPSFSDDVLGAIHKLAEDRDITHVNYFTPKFNKYSEVRTWCKTNMDSINLWKEYIYPEWAEVRDPYTNRKVFFPSVYFNAYYDILHWINAKDTPLAGKKNYVWKGFTTGTMIPYAAKDDEFIANHNAGINTMVEDGLGNATPYEQITAQTPKIVSALSEINNSMVLCEMVKIARRIASENRWSDMTTAVQDYKNIVEDAIKLALGNCYETLEVIAEQEAVNGAGKNRIYCRINVKFKGIFKGVTYEFYIIEN